MKKRVAFATYRDEPGLTQSDRMVALALEKRQVTVKPIIWGDPDPDWHSLDAVVVRSTWDYHLHFDEFVRWISRIEGSGAILINSAPAIRWNLKKTYLRELEGKGIRIVPTLWLSRDSSAELPLLLAESGWGEVVIKPTISASAFETWIADRRSTMKDQERLLRLLRSGDVMIQPVIKQVQSEGEWSFVFICGEYSHSVLKKPKDLDFRVQEQFGGVVSTPTPSQGLLAGAHAVMKALEHKPLFARVDGVDMDGELVLMEVELIEPELFFALHPHAADRFASAIANAINTST